MPVVPSSSSGSPSVGSAQVVTTAEIKKHVEIAASDTSHDTQLASLELAARKWWEEKTECLLLTRPKTVTSDCFPMYRRDIKFAFYPVTAVASITYDDTTSDGNTFASTDWVFSSTSFPQRIGLVADKQWPEVKSQADVVTIACTAGYGTAVDVPEPIKQCLLMMIAHFFENREATIVGTTASEMPLGVQAIVALYEMGDAYLGTWR